MQPGMLYDSQNYSMLNSSFDGVINMRDETTRQRARFGKPFEENLVRAENGCLLWTGPTDKDGYGMRGARIGERRAHRYAYARVNGPIPEGVIIRHECDTPACCEPEHLIPGDQLQNIADKISRDRQAKGSRIGKALLTEDMVREIRALYSSGMTQTQIAGMFPVTQSSVSLIVLRKQWKHI